MIRFQTESKIYRFVKDTLSFTDTNPIWLSTVRNATIENLDPDDSYPNLNLNISRIHNERGYINISSCQNIFAAEARFK